MTSRNTQGGRMFVFAHRGYHLTNPENTLDAFAAAEAMGVNTTRAKVLSFVISSGMAGVAGGLFAFYNMYLHTNSFTFIRSIEIIIMIVIGGLGSILGSIVGAVLFIALTEGLRAFEQYRMVLFSLALILLMIYRPQGLLGAADFSRKGKR